MKKIILTVVAMMAIATTTFAENDNKTVANIDETQYAFSFNSNSIAHTLRLTNDQKEDMEGIHNTFARDMKRAAKVDITKREKLTKKAVIKDLAYMRSILDQDQYYKYRMLLQVTLNNRGLIF